MTRNDKSEEYKYNQIPVKDNVTEKQEVPTEYGYGVRHVQLVIVFMCLMVNFIARGHLGVTVVAMSSHTEINTDILNTSLVVHVKRRNTTYTDTIIKYNEPNNVTETNLSLVNENDTVKSVKTFDWPKSTQEMVLGSFFVGYCIMTFPIGLMVQRWGGKLPLQIALFINGIVSLVTPWLTLWGGWKAVSVCRIMQGLSQAGVYPSVQSLLANWVPAAERATLSSYTYTGTIVGTVISFQLAGFLADSQWGWPSIYWAVGVICLLTFTMLTFFGAASPAQHKFISDDEKNYILGRVEDGSKKRRPKTPWKAIFKSRPMWSTLVTHVGSGIAFVFYFTQVPSYIHYILEIDVKQSGILSSLPYMASFFTSITFGLLSDYCTNRNMISTRNARRISNSISQVGMALCLLCASFTRSTTIAVCCFVVAMACHSAIHTGWMINHIDLASNFSGTLMAIGNTVMNTFNVLLPIIVSQIVTDVRDIIQWRIMFFSIAGVAFTCNAIFVIFMSSDSQPWNDVDGNDIPLKEAKMDENEEKNE